MASAHIFVCRFDLYVVCANRDTSLVFYTSSFPARAGHTNMSGCGAAGSALALGA